MFLPLLDYGDLLYMHASAHCLDRQVILTVMVWSFEVFHRLKKLSLTIAPYMLEFRGLDIVQTQFYIFI